MQAYKGTTVAGFPNLFFLVGPNTGLGHNSIVFMIESQIDYVPDALRTMRRHGARTLEVRQEAQAAYNAELDRMTEGTVWVSGGCTSYYIDRQRPQLGALAHLHVAVPPAHCASSTRPPTPSACASASR